MPIVALLAVLILTLFSPAGPAAGLVAAEIPIRGQVFMAAEVPMEGARIELHNAPRSIYQRELGGAGLAGESLPLDVARTGEDGRFEIFAPESGYYQIRVRMPGFLSMALQRLVLDEGVLDQAVELRPVRLPRSVDLRVLVEDPEGQIVPGARVHLPFKMFNDAGDFEASRFWRPANRTALTGEDGAATLVGGRSEEIELWSQMRGFVPALPQRLALLTEKTLRLEAGVSRLLEVRDAEDRPVAGALVTTYWPVAMSGFEPEPVVEGVTDEDGRLLIVASPRGSLELSARTALGLIGEMTLETPASDDLDVSPAVLRLHPEPLIFGTVTDQSTGRSIAGAWIVVPHGVVQTDGDGRFSLSRSSIDRPVDMPVDRVIHAAAPGFVSTTSTVRHGDDGEISGLDLRLKPARILAGTVVNESGEAVAGATIEAMVEAAVGGGRGFTANLPFTAVRSLGRRQRLAIQAGRHLEAGRPGLTRPWFTRSDSGGAFHISVTHGGSFWLQAARDGYLPTHLTVDVNPDAEPVRVVLRRARLGFGYVLDLSERPVVGAEVRLWEVKSSGGGHGSPATFLARTDKTGRFEISELKPGRFDLRATAEGFAPLSVEDLSVVFDAAGGEVDLGMVILEPGVRVAGRVEDADGHPIEGVKVSYELWSSAGRLQPWETESTEVTADADGQFSIEDLLLGENLDLTLWHIDYVAAEAQGVPAPTEDLLITLESNSVVRGRVVGPDGAPVAGSRVSAHFRAAAGSQLGQGTNCDDSGHFVLDRVGSRGVEIRATAPGFLSARVWLDLQPGEEVEGLVLELEPGASLEGTVFTPSGVPAVDAWISTSGIPRQFDSGGAATDAQGRFRLSGLELGPQKIHVIAEGFPEVERRLEISPGVTRAEIHLEAGYEVRGQVMDADGLPVAGARVRLGGIFANTGEDGGFRLEEVVTGQRELRVQKAGFAGHQQDIHVDGPIHDVWVELSRGTRVHGRILGQGEGNLSHIQIWGWSLEGDQAIGSVGHDNSFRFPPVAPGKWTFEAVEAAGGRRARGMLEIEEGVGEAQVDLEFHAGLLFSGSVRVDGEPEAGGTVRLRGLDVLAGGLQRVDYDGVFEFDDLRPGRYSMTIRGAGRGVLEVRQLDLASDRHVDFDLATQKVWGEVIGALERRPLEGADLTLKRRDQGISAVEMDTTSDAGGRFRFERLGEGSYHLLVEKEGYAAQERVMEVAAGSSSGDLTLALEPTAGLTLSVTHAFGGVPEVVFVAVLGARVAEHSPTPPGRLLVTSEGTVRLASLPPGTWDIVVRSTSSGTARLRADVPGRAVPVALPRGHRLEVRIPALVGGSEIATVTLEGAGGRFYSVEAGGLRHEWRASGGWAAVEGVPPGEWTVTASTLEGASWTGRVRTGGGGSVQVVLD